MLFSPDDDNIHELPVEKGLKQEDVMSFLEDRLVTEIFQTVEAALKA